MKRVSVALAVVGLLAAAAFVSSGCAPSPQSGGGGASSTVPAPGLEVRDDGTGIAAGWVDQVDLEGGVVWILRDSPPDGSTDASTVVVLLPGKVPETRFAELLDRYARAEGAVNDGPSIRMAGPEMTVDLLEEVGGGDLVR